MKRRNVLRTLAVYAGPAFVILEAADILFSRWNLPEWAFDLVFYLLILGAFITIITSWIFDVTPEGLERTKPISEVRKSEKPVVSAGWKAATFVSVVVIIGLVIFNVAGGFQQAKAGSLTSIMILPFENYTGDETLEYLVSGMQSELIGEMGQISNLRVISETTSRYYREKGLPLHQIARELGIDAVVEPTVMCHGDSLCVQVKLIGVKKEEKQLWVGDYTEDKSQILNLYSNVSRKIADEVKVELTDEEAIRAFQEALPIESGYGLASGNLWKVYYLKGQYERAWEVRDPNLPLLLWPGYDNLREDIRFQDISRRMNLPYRPPSV